MKVAFSFLFCILFACLARADATDKLEVLNFKKDPANRGWDYLVQKLIEHGVPEASVKSVYQSDKMPKFELVYFTLDPKESPRLYTNFYAKPKMIAAREFLSSHEPVFVAQERKLGVSKYIITAIMLIETQLGKVTGNQSVVYRLSRLAVIGAPDNIQANIERLTKKNASTQPQRVIERAKYLEEMFFPELPAVIEIASAQKIDIFDLKGSSAGAFGYPQFLPSTYQKFALDGNGDGVISLFQYEDSIWSVANFLASYGWQDSLPLEAKQQVIWKYNHSQAYVDAVLGVAETLQRFVASS